MLRSILMAAALAALLPVGAQETEQLLSKRVSRFTFRGSPATKSRGHLDTEGHAGTIVDGAIHLAHHAEVRIAMESLPPGQREVPIEIDARNKAVGEVLGEMVRQDPRYKFRERLGVIEVLPLDAEEDPASCLNRVVPELRFHYSFRDAWLQLRCEVGILAGEVKGAATDPLGELDPVSGLQCVPIGSRMTHPPAGRIETVFKGTSLRDIMDQVVSAAGNLSWFVTWNGETRSCNNISLGYYQPILGHYPPGIGPPDVPNPNPDEWMEGLDHQCTSCHYHEEQRKK